MKIFDALSNFLSKMFAPPVERRSTLTTPEEIEGTTISYKDDTLGYSRLDNYRAYEQMESESPEFSEALEKITALVCQGDDVLMRGPKAIAELEEEEKKEAADFVNYGLQIMDQVENETDMENINIIIKSFERRTKLKYRLPAMIRAAVKYGDNFEEIIYGSIEGDSKPVIARFLHIDPSRIELNLDTRLQLDVEYPYYFVQAEGGEPLAKYKPGQIFRIQCGGAFENEYGRGLAYSGRKAFMRLDAVESGMVIGRLVRSHQRYLYKIDTTGLTTERAQEYVEKLKKFYAKKKLTDIYGNIKYVKQPLKAEEDLYFPVKKDSPADVEVLEGSAYLSYITDVTYLQEKFQRSLKMPHVSGGNMGSRNAMAELDTDAVRFVKSIQNSVRMALEDIYKRELKLHGYDVDIDIEMPEISSVTEYRKWEMERLRAEICKIHTEAKTLSIEYLLENILYLTDEEIDEVMEQLDEESMKSMERERELMKLKTPPEAPGAEPSMQGKASPVRVTTGLKRKQTGKAGNNYTSPSQAEGEAPEPPIEDNAE